MRDLMQVPFNYSGTVSFQYYPEIVDRIKQFNHESIGRDESGLYEMWAITLGNPLKPSMMLFSNMHPTEWQTGQYGLKFFEDLRDDTFPNKQFRDNLLQNFHLVYVPVLNPWGLQQMDDLYTSNYTARYNSNYVELNGDFYYLTQQESKNAVKLISKYKPFAVVDMHMFQPNYSVAYGNRMILANGQEETTEYRDWWRASIEEYLGERTTMWTNVLDSQSNLLRGYAAKQSNPHTPHTLSYITELVRPFRVDGEILRKFTDDEIFKYGVATMFFFFESSMTYYAENKIDSISGDISIINTSSGGVIELKRNNEGFTVESTETKNGNTIKTEIDRDITGIVLSIKRILE